MSKLPSIGGQALIEGVMIRSPKYTVMTARVKKKIVSKTVKNKVRKGAFYKLPVVRGFFNMVDMMRFGMKALMWSAEQQGEKEEKITPQEMFFTVALSIGFAILLFMIIPYFSTVFIGVEEETQPILFNLIDGLIRIAIFFVYIYLISIMKDIRVMFQYHGAEHMSIHAYEHKKPMTVNAIRKFTTLHPRCGTAFIMIVLVVSILVFAVVTPAFLALFPALLEMSDWVRKPVLVLLHIVLIPFVAGLSYEVLKLGDKYQNNPLMKIFIAPGLAMQLITTNKPTKAQIEVAMTAVQKIMKLEKIKY